MTIYVEIPHTNDDDVDLFKFTSLYDVMSFLIDNGIESFTVASEDARNMVYNDDDYTDYSKIETRN